MYIYSTITTPRTPLKRISDKKRSSMEKLAEIRQAKVEKHGRACQIKSPVCTGREQSLHHLLKKSQGGGNTHENTLLSCLRCQTFIEDNPQWAVEHGFTQRRS